LPSRAVAFACSQGGEFIGGATLHEATLHEWSSPLMIALLGRVLFGKDLDRGALMRARIVGSIVGLVVSLLAYRVITRRRSAEA
jgi:hypothetical protein